MSTYHPTAVGRLAIFAQLVGVVFYVAWGLIHGTEGSSLWALPWYGALAVVIGVNIIAFFIFHRARLDTIGFVMGFVWWLSLVIS